MINRYIALIPAYDPTPILCDLVRNLCNAGFSIVIVDDGSKIAAAVFLMIASPALPYCIILKVPERGRL